ncbi:MAG: radical SAM protein [Methanocellales archaeon]
MGWIFARPDAELVWQNAEVRRRLSWYYAVMLDEKPSKFLICKRIEANFKQGDSIEDLWREHSSLAIVFKETLQGIASGEIKLEDLEVKSPNFLDLKIEIVNRLLESCIFCERRCKANRKEGAKGFCELDSVARVSSCFHHYGEEAPLVPSGTIFFTSCNFRCQFCQNWDISTDPYNGVEVDPKKLASLARTLRREGCRNINYVGGDPTPNLHIIVESLRYLDINVPLLWNSNLYCSEEAMKILTELMDIWLPDFKYYSDACAERLSKVKNYFAVVSRNHKLAHESGDIIIRHLVLPNHLDCDTKPLLEWIASNLPRALVNIMGQYRPEHVVARTPHLFKDIARRPSFEEMDRAMRIAKKLGIVYEPVS